MTHTEHEYALLLEKAEKWDELKKHNCNGAALDHALNVIQENKQLKIDEANAQAKFLQLDKEIKQLKEELQDSEFQGQAWHDEAEHLRQKLEQIKELVDAIGFAKTIKEKFKEILDAS